jgi:hypothetical protein
MEIAATIYTLPVDVNRYVVADRFATWLAAKDPRFNREKFMAAAVWGVEEHRRSLIAVPRGRPSRTSQ